ncbi:MAG: GGDEF domain-containing protein [Psychromonas sp.]|nr:GGDEF domain-containing protein [Psychromonas sp.]
MSERKKSIFFDFILIILVNSAFAFLFIKMNLFERIYHFPRDYESIQLDEVFFLLFTLLISLMYVFFRRWRDRMTYSLIAQDLASKDPLTKLLSRRTLESCLATEWERYLRYHEDFCIILFDLDDFSDINDNLGYLEGDRILINVADMVGSNTRKTDHLARWGEEEFIILCPACKSEQATVVAEKLRSNLYRTLKDGVELSASFAVVQSDKTASLEELMKRAHFSLHKAKGRGKNCVVSS